MTLSASSRHWCSMRVFGWSSEALDGVLVLASRLATESPLVSHWFFLRDWDERPFIRIIFRLGPGARVHSGQSVSGCFSSHLEDLAQSGVVAYARVDPEYVPDLARFGGHAWVDAICDFSTADSESVVQFLVHPASVSPDRITSPLDVRAHRFAWALLSAWSQAATLWPDQVQRSLALSSLFSGCNEILERLGREPVADASCGLELAANLVSVRLDGEQGQFVPMPEWIRNRVLVTDAIRGKLVAPKPQDRSSRRLHDADIAFQNILHLSVNRLMPINLIENEARIYRAILDRLIPL